ncbi:hypothetical protein [Deinococcus humi]|uniref:Uncharacterized protein n=1 Tax=Deinococcus humi TaxID=662880 RepID=A0A7W8NG10_9DEIO|nr:hypothetical protein [Deinococcus humi]MBB5366044.1 hypothetical protein [Deinococcus humi]GGO39916.1 hypothetical protein GCM10008949_48710 [Deinococcus humi]
MTRAPIKLSREMKLLLLLLLMVALIGAWYVWTNSRAASALPEQGSAPSSAGSAETGTDAIEPETGSTAAETTTSGANNGTATADRTPAAAAALPGTDTGLPSDRPVASGSGETDPGSAGTPGTLAVQPNRPVEIEVIPPFPTPEVSDAVSTDSTTPGGINPQASIAAIPSNNPFRPLKLDESAQTTASTSVSVSTPITPDRTSIPSSSGDQNSDVQITPITPSSAGPLAITPIPGAGGSVRASSGSLSGLPVIPGGDGSTGLVSPAIPDSTGSGATVSGSTPDRTIAGTSGDSGVTVIGGSTVGTTGSSAAASRTPNAAGSPTRTTPQGNVVVTAPKPPKPIAPPIAGMNVPSVTRVPTAVSRPAASPSANPSAAGSATANSTATSRPVPGIPQVITALGQDAAAQDQDTAEPAPAASQLEQFVQKRQLAFNAAVLGPINTAIFRGQDGYVVVAVGQTLPDSQVTVKEVSATSAVLSLGNDLKTLELDQR